MATNSSLEQNLKKWVEDSGLNPRLPYAILDQKGQLLGGNRRMFDILGLPLEHVELPLARDKIQNFWPFFNEDKSGLAIFETLLKVSESGQVLKVEAHLKNYNLHLRWIPTEISGLKKKIVCVLAELVRAGDLLDDTQSRQVLFRSLSHEIRTSVSVLKGYYQILQDTQETPPPRDIVIGMGRCLERLEKVVLRLEEFKTAMKLGGGL